MAINKTFFWFYIILLTSCVSETWNKKKDNLYSKNEYLSGQLRIDSITACQRGIDSALVKARKGEYFYYKFMSPGNKNQKYHQRFLEELNKRGITYQTVYLTDVIGGSHAEFKRSCYLNQMKVEIKRKYGEDWLESLRIDN